MGGRYDDEFLAEAERWSDQTGRPRPKGKMPKEVREYFSENAVRLRNILCTNGFCDSEYGDLTGELCELANRMGLDVLESDMIELQDYISKWKPKGVR